MSFSLLNSLTLRMLFLVTRAPNSPLHVYSLRIPSIVSEHLRIVYESTNSIFCILDANIEFEAEIARKRLPCHLELGNVQENQNVLAINLTRTRNIHNKVGILCRTKPASAQEGLDYEGRNSIVWFEANQTVSTCNVSIINDQLHEVSEYFRVILEGVENGKAQPAFERSKLCVFIRADIDDGKCVNFIVQYYSDCSAPNTNGMPRIPCNIIPSLLVNRVCLPHTVNILVCIKVHS